MFSTNWNWVSQQKQTYKESVVCGVLAAQPPERTAEWNFSEAPGTDNIIYSAQDKSKVQLSSFGEN